MEKTTVGLRCLRSSKQSDLRMRFAISVTCFVTASLFCGVVQSSPLADSGKCQRVNILPCQDFYNMTYYPNPTVGVDSQEEAARTVHEFQTLFRLGCAPLLRFFVCSMYVPMCYQRNGVAHTVHSCRQICEASKAGCEPIMARFGFLWPDTLDCKKLPRKSTPQKLCMSARITNENSTPTTPSVYKPTSPALFSRAPDGPPSIDGNDLLPQTRNELLKLLRSKGITENSNFNWKMFEGKTVYNVTFDFKFRCDLNPSFVYINEQGKEKCAPRCNSSIVYGKADKSFSDFWTTTWALICFLSTMVTVSTFSIDSTRFRYPERPIVFLSLCYAMSAIAHLIRMVVGRNSVICRDSKYGSHVAISGLTPTGCTVVFSLLYYFTMASAIWWIVLSLTWFLSAAMKWGHEAVQKYSSVFHGIAWTAPAIQTAVALVTKQVDADELSGLCFVGNYDSASLLWFVIAPLLGYLLIGSVFLLAGFVSLFKIRKALKQKTNTFKLERLMFRIGMFTVLYIVPASFVIGCFFNDYRRLTRMESSHGTVLSCMLDASCTRRFAVEVEMMYVKYFMMLVVGVTSGIWIWTSKTLLSWQVCYNKCRGKEPKSERIKQAPARPGTLNGGQYARANVDNQAMNNDQISHVTGFSQIHAAQQHLLQPRMIVSYSQPHPHLILTPQQSSQSEVDKERQYLSKSRTCSQASTLTSKPVSSDGRR